MTVRSALLAFTLLVTTCFGFGQSVDRYTVIPRPAQLEPRAGEFIINNTTRLVIPVEQAELRAIADTFAHQLNRATNLNIQVRNSNPTPGGTTPQTGNVIQFSPSQDTSLGEEGYQLDVTNQLISIEARHPKGFFYAVQTLYQLLPPTVLGVGQGAKGRGTTSNTPSPQALSPLPLALTIPACRIQDRPRYVYRGMHLDVSRHFFPVAFIKKYIDLMALHKFNNFHWHLTDDQGWRIEIKKYPKLTQVGAQRRETLVGHYDEYDPQVFDGKPYSGFYTQDDIREVVRYAAAKYINVVPEIEMPGHALAALAAYPELGCNGRSDGASPYQVATKWGVFDDVFCPYDKTFQFLEDVLTEVMALFPSKYIHIGGDECPKSTWRKSDFAQQLMRQQNLKDENALQSYFINRIDKFVNAKGRRIIGWDEILEGNSSTIRLSPDATVMSWRGIKGGIEAARQRHDVIMTPGQYCYFDQYQGDPAQEPMAFGGQLPIAMVYSYNPTPTELSPTEATHILGAQGNIWTEYLAEPAEVEYMAWPRAAALAEVLWTPLAQKNYTDFSRRLPAHFARLTALNVNFARTFYDVTPSAKPIPNGKLTVTLSADALAPDIRYTVDGSVPSSESPRYERPFMLDQSTTVRAATFSNGQPLSQLAKIQREFIVSSATGKAYKLLSAPTTGRPDRNYSLTDGTTGSMGGYELANVVSFANDINVIIDLGKPQPVSSVRVGFVKYTARNLCLPKQVEILVSDDGQTFRPVLSIKTNAAEGGKRGIVRLPFDFAQTTARYVQVIALNVGQVPAGLRNPGKPAQMAVDEIEVK
ncbi:family 20 glycosylhydrolase [Spirosoma soli]|uniref:beta-N-acetylhexosaminidase n=1 Tax=Spirosoma soli TaxID=1770529 RepID=A0ABW5M4H8_9BACT